MAGRTIRTNLIWVLFAAIFPLVTITAWQIWLAVEDSRELVANRLRANAWSIAESDRDPFVIAGHSLSVLAAQRDVQLIGSACSTNLAGELRGATAIVNFLRVDADGKLRCAVLPFADGHDMSSENWWRAREGRTSLYLAEPKVGAISDLPVLMMVKPIMAADGAFNGTVSATVSIAHLRRSIEAKTSVSSVVFVVDRQGRPLVGAGRAGFEKFDQVVMARERPHMLSGRDGKRWTYVSAPFFAEELYIVYAEPAKTTWKSTLFRMWPSLLLPLLALLFTGVAIWVSTRHLILRWLERLRDLTARFARGDFNGALHEFDRAPTELAQFASDLHDMAQAIEKQESDLRHALSVTTALTKEVNHRVKNNLQIVSSLLALQVDRVTDPVAQLALSQARSRIVALGLIHRLLYESDHGTAVGTADMAQLLEGLCAQFRQTYKTRRDIELHCHAQQFALPADQAVPVTLFTVEAVANAFQHGFGEGRVGKINVDFTARDGEAEMRVEDDGTGFTDATSAGNTGIDLIRAYAEQAGGKIDISSQPGATVLSMRFPLQIEGAPASNASASLVLR